MTNAELLAKIKDFANEQKDLLEGFELQSDFRRGETAAYSAIISFLSTLESEKPMELEEEVKRYYSDNFDYISSDQPTLSILTNIARHFTEWQKEQMMKEAIGGNAYPNDGEIWIDLARYGYKFKEGEPCRIIIVKEDEK